MESQSVRLRATYVTLDRLPMTRSKTCSSSGHETASVLETRGEAGWFKFRLRFGRRKFKIDLNLEDQG